jgi:crotonobetainyl-CoA:carnitine CoA-transferase CaiB-like acyl-CoA transferase
MPGPLEGYRVVDLTAMITGPFATMILADQGADVVKVEPPGLGDIMRYIGTNRNGIASFWASTNRSKRSIVLNLRDDRGRELLKRLVSGADVFVQNFRPGVVERLGIDEPALRAVRPDLIYVSISAYGPSGPYARRPAYDHILQGMTGFATLQADEQDGKPRHVRNAVVDKLTALNVAQGVTAALLARERSGEGQHLRVSMLDAAIAFLWPDGGANAAVLEEDVPRLPLLASTYRVTATADGYFCAAVLTDAQVHGLFRAMGRSELVEDPRFATAPARMQHMDALLAELEDAPTALCTAEVLAALDAEGVPCGPVLAIEDVPHDPQVRANGTFLENVHPQLGRMREPRPPLRFERTPAEIRRPAPALGAHTDEVLAELGLGPAELGDLRAKGVIG